MTSRPLYLVGFALLLLIVSVLPNPVLAQRGLLWRIVQGCLINNKLTGLSFPCLAVETAKGLDLGYAVIRVPTEDVHLIVTPTVRTIGVEAHRVRGSDAPNYFQDAWESRAYIADKLSRTPAKSDIGLAINSRPGRSQDQLHIHVGCVKAEVKRVLSINAATIQANAWTKVKILAMAPLYSAHYVRGRDLVGLNVFDQVADGLKVPPQEMDLVTIVVAGADPEGFYILARKKLPHVFDKPHGEALLDSACENFTRP